MLASSFVQPGEGVKFHLQEDCWSVLCSYQPDLQTVSAEQASKEVSTAPGGARLPQEPAAVG